MDACFLLTLPIFDSLIFIISFRFHLIILNNNQIISSMKIFLYLSKTDLRLQ